MTYGNINKISQTLSKDFAFYSIIELTGTYQEEK